MWESYNDTFKQNIVQYLFLVCVIAQLMCVSGLCDGGAADTGVRGGKSCRMSKKQRPYGSSDQVGWRFLFAQAFVSWTKLYLLGMHYYISQCDNSNWIFVTGRPHQTLWPVTNWWTERAPVSSTSLVRDLSVSRHNATSAPTLFPRSLASVATIWAIHLAVPL